MTTAIQTVQMLPATAIVPGTNDRQVFHAEALRDLASSIATNGLAQPITVRPLGDGTFQIVAGERRFRAISQVLQRPTVPCLVRDLSDEMASALMLAENTGRQDLTPIEEAQAYQARIDRFGWSETEVADTAGVSADVVRKRLLLLRLLPDAQHLVATGNLSLGQAESMARLDSNRQISALRILQSSAVPLTVTAFRSICQQLYDEQCQDGLFTLEAFWVQQVQQTDPLPKRGKQAVTGAPTRQDLPTVPFVNTDTIGQVFDRYIKQLLDAGNTTEAATLGTLYTFLVQNNWVRVPDHAQLLHDA